MQTAEPVGIMGGIFCSAAIAALLVMSEVRIVGKDFIIIFFIS
jgi:hypothetical protein